MKLRASILLSMLAFSTLPAASFAQGTAGASASITVHLDQPAKAISPDLFGIFFEDLNWAADGGLYAELIQNRSFEYSSASQLQWNEFTAWQVVNRGGARGNSAIGIGLPLNANNPHYAMLEVGQAGEASDAGVALVNGGFDGLPVVAGESYDLSFFASMRTFGQRWGGSRDMDQPFNMVARLEKADGTLLAQTPVVVSGRPWKRYTATLTPTATEPAARFVLMSNVRGGVALDEISLFPKKTFKNRPNGLRADLAQALADLKPRFVRFPGGCLVHGHGLPNLYRWQDTIGPVEQRRQQFNLWGYHQSAGLGYYEYFQFCEDIGAIPLPVVPAGVSCQNSAHTSGTGQQPIPLDQMPAYIQEISDLIEWANGPATSTWGAKRAAAGHPAPFGLKYLGIGNEDAQTPEYRERFEMIFKAIRAKHPEIVLVGNSGPAPSGEDFDAGWKTSRELNVPIVDEHYYQAPNWFLENFNRYDSYDRNGPKVYIGEYASRGNAWSNALAEAAYMCNLERNGDVVVFASYAPLLARIGHTQWNPDLIYFTPTQVFPTVNYLVQQAFGVNSGDRYLPSTVSRTPAAPRGQALAFSSVRDSQSGDIVLKITNVSPGAVQARIAFSGEAPRFAEGSTRTIIAGDPGAQNNQASPRTIVPQTSPVTPAASFTQDVPPHSLTVLRLKTQR